MNICLDGIVLRNKWSVFIHGAETSVEEQKVQDLDASGFW